MIVNPIVLEKLSMNSKEAIEYLALCALIQGKALSENERVEDVIRTNLIWEGVLRERIPEEGHFAHILIVKKSHIVGKWNMRIFTSDELEAFAATEDLWLKCEKRRKVICRAVETRNGKHEIAKGAGSTFLTARLRCVIDMVCNETLAAS